ncbi:hypothetical protein C8R43DRAFT_1192474 [Mycena crocata]|nr:hypothetical protein C8R43DRAFT_1192474 [Mycena crocata]
MSRWIYIDSGRVLGAALEETLQIGRYSLGLWRTRGEKWTTDKHIGHFECAIRQRLVAGYPVFSDEDELAGPSTSKHAATYYVAAAGVCRPGSAASLGGGGTQSEKDLGSDLGSDREECIHAGIDSQKASGGGRVRGERVYCTWQRKMRRGKEERMSKEVGRRKKVAAESSRRMKQVYIPEPGSLRRKQEIEKLKSVCLEGGSQKRDMKYCPRDERGEDVDALIVAVIRPATRLRSIRTGQG